MSYIGIVVVEVLVAGVRAADILIGFAEEFAHKSVLLLKTNYNIMK